MNNILIIGSTGTVGRALTAEFTRSGEHVLAATRNPAAMAKQNGVTPVRFDSEDPSTFAESMENADRIFLLAPGGDAHPQRTMTALIELAARTQKKVVLMSGAGTEKDPKDPMHEVEIALQSAQTRYVILRPNWFMDNFHLYWLPAILEGGVIPVPAENSRSAFIDVRDIAASAARVLRTDRFDGGAYTLTGPQSLTYTEAAETISRISGRAIQYVSVDDETFRRSLVEAGIPEHYEQYLVDLFEATRRGDKSEVTSAVEEITGQPARSLETYVRDYVEAFRTQPQPASL